MKQLTTQNLHNIEHILDSTVGINYVTCDEFPIKPLTNPEVAVDSMLYNSTIYRIKYLFSIEFSDFQLLLQPHFREEDSSAFVEIL